MHFSIPFVLFYDGRCQSDWQNEALEAYGRAEIYLYGLFDKTAQMGFLAEENDAGGAKFQIKERWMSLYDGWMICFQTRG